MSKYNLIDIFEQYQIGSGFTRDFDYAGMLNAGLKTGVDTDIEILRKMSDDFEDVNYHRENNHLQKAIDALEEGAIKEASMFFGDFHAEIKSTMETFDMDTSDNLGAFMASKMEENTEAVDLAIEASQEKAGIKEDKDKEDKDKEPRDGVKSAAAKLGMKPKHVKEVRIEREVASRIEGLLNIQLKKQFLDVFEDLWLDLIEEDPFYAEDVIAHLSNEMSKQISNRQAQGDRLAGMEESDSYVDEIGEGAMQPGEADLEAGVKGNMDALNEVSMKDVVLAIVKDTNATNPEVQMYIDSLTKDIKLNGKESYSDYEIDDYIEDFKNYISDKSLQEHFGRFMKDYQ
ncbi:hypothetical protein N9034_01330 [bacterium]|nr:hypothetical protein [bacterium]